MLSICISFCLESTVAKSISITMGANKHSEDLAQVRKLYLSLLNLSGVPLYSTSVCMGDQRPVSLRGRDWQDWGDKSSLVREMKTAQPYSSGKWLEITNPRVVLGTHASIH